MSGGLRYGEMERDALPALNANFQVMLRMKDPSELSPDEKAILLDGMVSVWSLPNPWVKKMEEEEEE